MDGLIISFILLFAIFTSITLCNDNDMLEQRRQKHKELESEVRRLFYTRKEFLDPDLRMQKDDLLCKCSNHLACGKDIYDIAGEQYRDVCKVSRGGYCGRMVRQSPDGEIQEVVTSCIHREQLIPKDRPFICQNISNQRFNQTVICCRNTAFCNDFELPIELGVTDAQNSTSSVHWYFLALLGVAVLFSAFGLCIGIFYCSPQRVKALWDGCIGWMTPHIRSSATFHREDDRMRHNSRLDKLLDDLEMTMSTGSGAGMPLLAQRTIARQITLKDCIGRGRFGEVYVGEWRGEKVAVKIFLSRDESSWQRETDIYRHNMLRHSNLLRWIASDNKDTGTSTQLWLVTEYLPNGSLFDYLEGHTISTQTGLQFARSIAHGLAYLHTEVPGVSNQCHKPAIAHRDIKSRNILVKNDLTCCIADLGMAIRYSNGEIDIPSRDRGGTARYLAPEFLTGNFNRDSFTVYLQMDIYALALVFWEICRRVDATNEEIHALPYEFPYQEEVPREPDLDEMRQCICVEGRRPTVPGMWANSKVLTELTRIMYESWSASPQSRLTALNIRCSLDRFGDEQGLQFIT